MKVIALKPGYFGRLRETGDEFEVPQGAKASWFAPAEQPAGKKPQAERTAGKNPPADGLV